MKSLTSLITLALLAVCFLPTHASIPNPIPICAPPSESSESIACWTEKLVGRTIIEDAADITVGTDEFLKADLPNPKRILPPDSVWTADWVPERYVRRLFRCVLVVSSIVVWRWTDGRCRLNIDVDEDNVVIKVWGG